MNQNQQPSYADVVLEELLNQNTMLMRDLALARAEIKMLKMEIENLKQSPQENV